MAVLIAGLAVFFGVHSISIAAPAWRDRVTARVGVNAWRGLHSVLALGGLAMIIVGYGFARQAPVVFYVPPPWLRAAAAALMAPVFPLVLASLLPCRIRAKARHPFLAAVKLWAAVHLLVNGSLADVLLFGSFLVWAVVDRISLGRRPPRPLPAAPTSRHYDAIAVAGGLALYAVFIFGAHRYLIGVPVLPGVGWG